MLEIMLTATAGGDDEIDRLIQVVMDGDPLGLRRLSDELVSRDRELPMAGGEKTPAQQLVGRVTRTLSGLSDIDGSKADVGDLWVKSLHMLRQMLMLLGLMVNDQQANGDRPEAALTGSAGAGDDREGDFEELVRAINRLEHRDPSIGAVICFRFFGGMSITDIAKLMAVPVRSLERRWTKARGWLND